MYSETVDLVVTRSGQRARIEDIKAYVNQVLRELSVYRFWHRSLVEDEITIDANPYNWTFPVLMHYLQAVRYKEINVYPALRRPGPTQEYLSDFFFAASDYYTFAGGFAVADTLDVAYYQMSPYYNYVELAARDAIWDQATNTWSYALTTPADDAAELVLETVAGNHWILLYWNQIVVDGALQMVFQDAGDERQPRAFARYKAGRDTLERAETWEASSRDG